MRIELKTITGEENKLTVQRFIDEFQTAGREDVGLEILSENFVDHSALPPLTPDCDGVIQLMRMLRKAFSEFHVEIHDQLADDDKVVTRKTFHGKHTGEFFSVPPTLRPIRLGVIDILRLENGKLVEHWCQVDLAGLMNQITTP